MHQHAQHETKLGVAHRGTRALATEILQLSDCIEFMRDNGKKGPPIGIAGSLQPLRVQGPTRKLQ